MKVPAKEMAKLDKPIPKGNVKAKKSKRLSPTAEPRPPKAKKEEVDLQNLSAYAVYNNLVPGVKAYQDTSESTNASKLRKSKKKKALALKQESAIANANSSVASVVENSGNKNGKSSTNNGLKETKRITPTPVPVPEINKNKKKGAQLQTLKQAVKQLELPEAAEPTISKKKRNRKKNKTNNSEIPTLEQKSAEAPKGKKNGKVNIVPNPLANGTNKKQPKSKNSVDKITDLDSNQKGNKKKQQFQVVEVDEASQANDNDDDEPSEEDLWRQKNGNCINIHALLNSKPVADSVKFGDQILEWLIYPQCVEEFKTTYWEKQALLVKRGAFFPEYFEWMLSTAKLDEIIRQNVLKFTKNVDVVYYENGERITVSEDMNHRVRPAVLWDYYSTGNSIRILNPQSYSTPLRRVNTALQETFGTFVGANLYLTPPDAQGFAPHWDDIEAFVLQIEGKKRWKLYRPRNPNEVLPRYSSKDLGKEEDTLGKPFIDVTMQPGDLLYFPRGTIHQAKTVEGFHSMHITISCNQQNSWADLLKQHFSKAVDKLAATDVDLRKGLPMDYLSFMGLAPSKNKDATTVGNRKAFQTKLKTLITKVAHVEADDAADEMGKKFIWDSLPPHLTRKEKDLTVVEDGEFLNNGIVKNRIEVEPDTKMKLVRKNCVRLISEENSLRLYYSAENSLVYHEEEPQFVEIADEFQAAIEYLINSYPEFVRIEDLPIADNDIAKKIQLASDLWERAILMTDKPLEASEIDEDLEIDENGMEDEELESIEGSDDVMSAEGSFDEMDMSDDESEDLDNNDFGEDSEISEDED